MKTPLDASFAAHLATFQWLDGVALFFLAVIVGESIWDFTRRNRSSIWETAANFTIFAGNILLEYLGLGVLFVVGLYLLEPFALFSFSNSLWSWILAILVADFLYYWMHRWEHEIRILWAYHSVHHSSAEYNLSTSMRLSWVEGLVEWVFFLPMILLGFGTIETLIVVSVVVQYQTWIHTQKIGKLGFLDKILNTPSVHRVHHGSNAQYLDKNYGGILILWDRIFGTFQPEKETVIYGITQPLETSNPITINFHEFEQIFKDMKTTKGFLGKLKLVFGAPGISPSRRPEIQNFTGSE